MGWGILNNQNQINQDLANQGQSSQDNQGSQTQQIAQMFMPGLGIGSMIGNPGYGALGGAALSALFMYLHKKYGKDKTQSTDSESSS